MCPIENDLGHQLSACNACSGLSMTSDEQGQEEGVECSDNPPGDSLGYAFDV